MADRYTGRHIRQARNGAWMQKKRSRSRPGHANLPAAAALTISGFLIGGAGAVLQFGGTGPTNPGGPVAYDPADYPPPDRNAVADRASRDDDRADPARTTGTCQASYDDSEDLQGLRAATSDLPANAIVRVTNPANGKSVEVLVTAGSPDAGRCLDLSRDAFQEIASSSADVVDVRYEVLLQDAT